MPCFFCCCSMSLTQTLSKSELAKQRMEDLKTLLS